MDEAKAIIYSALVSATKTEPLNRIQISKIPEVKEMFLTTDDMNFDKLNNILNQLVKEKLVDTYGYQTESKWQITHFMAKNPEELYKK